MGLDAVPSSERHSLAKRRQNRGDEDNRRVDVEHKLVLLVFKPLLSCLWFLGLPVPELCTHNATLKNSNNACGVNGLENWSLFSKGVETDVTVFQKCSKLLHNATAPTDDITHFLGAPGEAERETTGFASSEGNLCHVQVITIAGSDKLRDELQKQTVTDVQLMTANQRSVKDGGIGIFSKGEGVEREELPKDDAEKADMVRERRENKADETDGAIKYELETADKTGTRRKETKGRESPATTYKSEAKTKMCRSCRRKTVVGRIIFALNVVLFVANVGRYATIFFDVTALSGSVVASIVMMMFFLLTLYLYVASFHSLSKHLPRLVQLLQIYDSSYSVTIDCVRVNRKMKMVIVLSVVLQAASAIALAVGFHSFLPSFRRHLSPWHDLEGVNLYVASAILGLVLCSMINAISALSLWLHTSSYLLRKEFNSVAGHIGLLFRSSEDSIIANAGKTIANNNRQDPKQLLSSSTVFRRKKVTPNMTRNPSVSTVNVKNEKEHVEFSHTLNPKLSPGLKPQHLAQTNVEDVVHVHALWQGHDHASRNPRGHVEQQQQITQTNGEGGAEVKSHWRVQHGSSRLRQSHTEQSNPNYPEHLQDFEGAFDCFYVQRESEGKAQGTCEEPTKNFEDALSYLSTQHQSEDDGEQQDSEDHLEDAFDHLHTQHQILCAILRRSQGCLRHLVSMVYFRYVLDCRPSARYCAHRNQDLLW